MVLLSWELSSRPEFHVYFLAFVSNISMALYFALPHFLFKMPRVLLRIISSGICRIVCILRSSILNTSFVLGFAIIRLPCRRFIIFNKKGSVSMLPI